MTKISQKRAADIAAYNKILNKTNKRLAKLEEKNLTLSPAYRELKSNIERITGKAQEGKVRLPKNISKQSQMKLEDLTASSKRYLKQKTSSYYTIKRTSAKQRKLTGMTIKEVLASQELIGQDVVKKLMDIYGSKEVKRMIDENKDMKPVALYEMFNNILNNKSHDIMLGEIVEKWQSEHLTESMMIKV